eukprot:gene2129-2323_t
MIFNVSPSWEVLLYTVLLLALWMLVRVIAESLTTIWKFFGDKAEEDIIKVNPFLNGVKYAVSYWTERGGRPYQEDRFHTLKGQMGPIEASLYGVFDGHGGDKAAEYCKQNLLQAIINDPYFESNTSRAATNAFFRVDADFSSKAKPQGLTDGSTAVVAIIARSHLYVANAGDSRAVIVQKGGKTRSMSLDHRPERKDEESRIRKLGGTLQHWGRWRVQGVLAVSRAIGDVSLQPYITCEPELMDKLLDIEDEYLVLATDGLWDVLENEDVAKLVLSSSRENFVDVAKKLCMEAAIMGSNDNVTALVIDLK